MNSFYFLMSTISWQLSTGALKVRTIVTEPLRYSVIQSYISFEILYAITFLDNHSYINI